MIDTSSAASKPASNAGGTSAVTSPSHSTLHHSYHHVLAVQSNLAIEVAACRIDVTNEETTPREPSERD